ncbi:MAG: hypothetical protein WCY19_00385 [Candidatus Gastranaerophilaceae bacterium]
MKVTSIGFYSGKYNQPCNSQAKACQTAPSAMPLRKLSIRDIPNYAILCKPTTTFGISLPFEKMENIPCPCCGKIMISKSKFYSIIWPLKEEPLSADFVIDSLKKIRKKMNQHEKNVLKNIENFNVKEQNSTFDNLLEKINDPPEIFKNFYGCYRTLPNKEYNKKLIDILNPFESNMHDIEHEIFKQLKDLSLKSPQKSLQELLLLMRPEHMEILKTKQFKILDEVHSMADDLPYQIRNKIKNLVDENKALIIEENDEDPFKRKKFLAILYAVTNPFPKIDKIDKILEIASSIPTSQNNLSAFVVKYSGKTYRKNSNGKIYRTPQEISQRLISTSVSTNEHVFPLKPIEGLAGEDEPGNCITECAGDNNPRMSIPMHKWIESAHPDMPKNAQKYIDVVINKINNKELPGYEWYPDVIKETLKNASKGAIILDTSKLKSPKRLNFQPLLDKFNSKHDKH